MNPLSEGEIRDESAVRKYYSKQQGKQGQTEAGEIAVGGKPEKLKLVVIKDRDTRYLEVCLWNNLSLTEKIAARLGLGARSSKKQDIAEVCLEKNIVHEQLAGEMTEYNRYRPFGRVSRTAILALGGQAKDVKEKIMQSLLRGEGYAMRTTRTTLSFPLSQDGGEIDGTNKLATTIYCFSNIEKKARGNAVCHGKCFAMETETYATKIGTERVVTYKTLTSLQDVVVRDIHRWLESEAEKAAQWRKKLQVSYKESSKDATEPNHFNELIEYWRRAR